MTTRALVVGSGGTIGGAWSVAVLHALREQTGIEPAELEILQGTSAGAEIVTMLGGGAAIDDLVAMHRGTTDDPRLKAHIAGLPASVPPVPWPVTTRIRTTVYPGTAHARVAGLTPIGRGDSSWLERLADTFSDANGRSPHPGVRMVAYDLGDRRRVVFGAPDTPAVSVSSALRASWAIPGWMPPVRIFGHSYVDGGVASTASLDLLPEDIDLVYVVASMASEPIHRVPGMIGLLEDRLLRRPMSAVLAKEIDMVRARGTRVVPILPTTSDLIGLGAHFMNRDRRPAAFESAMTTAADTVARALRTGDPR